MAEMLQPNAPAPDFTLPDTDGKPVSLSDFRGKHVVLAFYPADWSSVCTSQLSLYQETLDDIRGRSAEVIGISVDGRWSHKAWAEQHRITFPLLSDQWPHGAVAERYGVLRPKEGVSERALFFIDKDGIIRETWVGEHPGISPSLNIVFDALSSLEQARRPDDGTQRSAITADDWSLGPADAPVTLLEYGDLECSYCGQAHPEIKAVLEQYPDQVRFVFRHFPITSLHPRAQAAALAAETAGAHGKFWEMQDLLLRNQQHLELMDLRRYALEIGLEIGRFDQEIGDQRYIAHVNQDFDNGVNDGVNGTPTLFLNGVRYDGPRDRDALSKAIDELLDE